MSVGIYIGRDAIQHSSWSNLASDDCMINVFRDGAPLLTAHPLSSLEHAPVILPPANTHDRYHRHRSFILSGGAAERRPGSASVSLSQIEVIITSPWTKPIPLLRPEQYPSSKHLAYFRFSSLPTRECLFTEKHKRFAHSFFCRTNQHLRRRNPSEGFLDTRARNIRHLGAVDSKAGAQQHPIIALGAPAHHNGRLLDGIPTD